MTIDHRPRLPVGLCWVTVAKLGPRRFGDSSQEFRLKGAGASLVSNSLFSQVGTSALIPHSSFRIPHPSASCPSALKLVPSAS